VVDPTEFKKKSPLKKGESDATIIFIINLKLQAASQGFSFLSSSSFLPPSSHITTTSPLSNNRQNTAMAAAQRVATVSRKTNETDIHITLTMDQAGAQSIEIDSGIGFLDHVPSFLPFIFFHNCESYPLFDLCKVTLILAHYLRIAELTRHPSDKKHMDNRCTTHWQSTQAGPCR
jgi:hypothetical protein